jgi:hypothetical protein
LYFFFNEHLENLGLCNNDNSNPIFGCGYGCGFGSKPQQITTTGAN